MCSRLYKAIWISVLSVMLTSATAWAAFVPATIVYVNSIDGVRYSSVVAAATGGATFYCNIPATKIYYPGCTYGGLNPSYTPNGNYVAEAYIQLTAETKFPVTITRDYICLDGSPIIPGATIRCFEPDLPPPPPAYSIELQTVLARDVTLPGNVLATIEPSKTVPTSRPRVTSSADLNAIVKDAKNIAVTNTAVTLTLEAVPNTGGHVHGTAQDRPKGFLSNASNPLTANRTTITGRTDANGKILFTYTAADPAGEIRIKASCVDAVCNQRGADTLLVRVQGLVQLAPDISLFELRGTGPKHPENHYFVEAARVKLIEVADKFIRRFNSFLILNDGSLPFGGLYDFQGNWANPHIGHRQGLVVDINNYVHASASFEDFAEQEGIDAVWEGGVSPHYHLLILGVDG